MATTISEVIGRGVRYQQISFEAFKGRLLGRGNTEAFSQGYVDMMRAKNEGVDNVAERKADENADNVPQCANMSSSRRFWADRFAPHFGFQAIRFASQKQTYLRC